MSLEKDGVFVDENEDGQAQVGETISYTFKVTNTGNVTLSNIVLEDDKVTVSGGPITSLAPGASDATTFTASYVLTQEDIDAGKVLNLAVARGEAPGGDPNDPSDDVTAESTDPTPVSADERDPECPTCTVTILPREASMSLEKDGVFVDENEDGQAQVGETISYTFKVTNTGNVTLSNIVLEDDKVTVSGGPITSLAPGASDATTFTASYVLTQEDIDAGKVLNLAVARGEAPGGDPNDPSDDVTAESTDPTPVSADERDPECPTCTVTILPREASMSLEKDGVFVDENEDGQAQVGETISYTFKVTNTGNVTLSNIVLEDDKVTVSGGPITSLAPGASDATTFTASYVLTQEDIDAGKVLNLAVARGEAPGGDPNDPSDDVTAESTDPTPVSADERDPECPTCTVTILPREASMSLEKDGVFVDENEDGQAQVGETISYTFKVTNTGNVTLSNIVLEDDKVTVSGGPITSLAPGASDATTFTASYVLTQEDIDAGKVLNLAVARGEAPGGDPNDPSDDVTAESTDPTPVSADERDPECPTCTVTILPREASMSLEKDGVFVDENEDGQAQVGETISYTFKVTNTGNVTLSNIVLEDDKVTVSGGPITSLAPGASDATTFTASYVLTQEDIDAGKVLNLAVARGEAPGGDPNDPSTTMTAESTDPTPVSADERDPECPTCTVTILPREASMSLEKDGVFVDENEDGQAQVGETISYTFKVTNTGNVTLSNIVLEDDKVTVSGGPITSLAPGASDATTFTASYVLTQEDIDAGKVLNLAVARGEAPGGDPNDPSDDVTAESTDPTPVSADERDPECPTCTVTILPREASMSLEKDGVFVDENEDGQAQVGETISYTFKVTNTGNVTLSNIVLEDDKVTVSGGPITSLAPGASDATTFTASYVLTQEDIDAGKVLNLAVARGEAPGGDPNDPSDDVTAESTDPTPVSADERDPECPTCTVTILPREASMSLEKDGVFVDENEDGQAQVGETISYTFKVTNTGNVTLSNIVLEDDKVTVSGGPITSLAPGASDATTFTASYVLTQEDIDAGKVLNLAVARGEAPGGDPNDPSDDVTAESTDPTFGECG
ncbi:hypothetical protein GYM62_16265 [Algoriphagus sp. NBT04N3]|uniref:DUF7507 domain-containing protein n=1 Tax=Algoriphagus sp. NBT04N3 TaxID=2705473 RepID=UPI001C630ADE|nr:hypothetical protein [Algoriphagus sp. NBT04N3]QYH40269.1 hypothetical protein GYM62_16265 [Algoriphagus sp. NBT04N3]